MATFLPSNDIHIYIFLIAHKVSKYVYIWGTTTCNYQRKNKSGICLESCYYCDEQLNCTEHVKNQMMNMFPWEHSFNTLFTVPCCLPVLLFTTSPSGFHETWRQRESLSRYKNVYAQSFQCTLKCSVVWIQLLSIPNSTYFISSQAISVPSVQVPLILYFRPFVIFMNQMYI